MNAFIVLVSIDILVLTVAGVLGAFCLIGLRRDVNHLKRKQLDLVHPALARSADKHLIRGSAKITRQTGHGLVDVELTR